MEVHFDLGRLDEIPDVVPPAELDAAATPPPAPSRAGAVIPGPARAQVRAGRVLALGAALGWLAMQVATLGLRGDLARLGTWYPLGQIALPALLGAAALALALWPGPNGLGAPLGRLRATALVALLGMTAATIFWPLPFAYVPTAPFGFGQWILMCADIVAIMGVVPLALAALVLRRSFVAAATDRSALVGTACGLGAVTAMHLHCENLEPAHMALGHMVPAIVIALTGAFVLRHVTRV